MGNDNNQILLYVHGIVLNYFLQCVSSKYPEGMLLGKDYFDIKTSVS